MSWLRLLLLCLTAVAAYQHRERDLFFTGIPDPEELPPSMDALQLEFVREYGDQDEGLVFGRIVGLAVSPTGTLAVLDQYGCQIWIVDTRTGDGNSIGGCGDGPEESREALVATFVGDTLVVWDWGRASMVKMTLEGEEIERARLSPFELGAMHLSGLHIGREGSILAGLDLLPNQTVSEHRHLALFDRFGGDVTRRGLIAPLLARSTPRNIVRTISFCAGATERGREVVLALNTWGPQAVLLRRSDFEPLLSVRIPFDWVRPGEHSRRPGHWGPMIPMPRVACGDRFAVAGYRDQGIGPDGEVGVSSAAMVVFDLREESMTVLGGDEPPEPGSVLFMTPGAATGNRFFLYTNGYFDYPVVREYRVVTAF